MRNTTINCETHNSKDVGISDNFIVAKGVKKSNNTVHFYWRSAKNKLRVGAKIVEPIEMFKDYDNLATNRHDIVNLGLNWTLKQDFGKIDELSFSYICNGDNYPQYLDEIFVEEKRGNITHRAFTGYVYESEKETSDNHPSQRWKVTCRSYAQVIYDTIIIQTFKNISAKEIIENVWKDRLTTKQAFPNPIIEDTEMLTKVKLGKIAHEDSIERLLNVICERCNAVWWMNGDCVLHLYTREGLEKNKIVLTDGDLGRDRSPVKIEHSTERYCNQVKFKAKDVRGARREQTHIFPNEKQTPTTATTYKNLSGNAKSVAESLGRWLPKEINTESMIAGIMANIEHESNFDPTKIEPPEADGRFGEGLAQWTDQARKNALLEFAGETKIESISIDKQIQFLVQGKTELPAVIAAHGQPPAKGSASDVTAWFVKYFEVPKDIPGQTAERSSDAERWVKMLSSGKTTEKATTEDEHGIVKMSLANPVYDIDKVVSDVRGLEWKEVNSIEKDITAYGQYTISDKEIQFYAGKNKKTPQFVQITLYDKISTVVIRDNLTEQNRLKQYMSLGYIVSKDITNERFKTIEEIHKYCEAYLIQSIKPTMNASFKIYDATIGGELTTLGFTTHSFGLGGLTYVKGLDFEDKAHYDNRALLLQSKSYSQMITGYPITLDSLNVEITLVDGFINNWESHFQRNMHQTFEDDNFDDLSIDSGQIDAQISFDIVADNLHVNGHKQASDINAPIVKASEDKAVEGAMK